MAKKGRRARRQPTRTAQPVRLSDTGEAKGKAAPVVEVNFSKEYRYVIEDLRRLALTGASLIALLIVLAIMLG